MLEDKYGPLVSSRIHLEGEVWPSLASRWWKDVMSLEEEGRVRWFNREVVRKVGVGMGNLFGKDAWVSSVPLMVTFRRLFSIANTQEVKVGELWKSSVAGGMWRFSWRRELFVWEVNMLNTLFLFLEGAGIGEGVDKWVWKPDKVGVFTVKSCYFLLQNLRPLDETLSTEVLSWSVTVWF